MAASPPKAKPPKPTLAALLLIKGKMGTTNDPNSELKKAQPLAGIGSHSDERVTYHQTLSMTNPTIPEDPNESKKISRKTKQLQVGLLDKKMEEIDRKQEATQNETLDSWKGFDSLNYLFSPHSAKPNPTPVPPTPIKQPTPPPSPKRQKTPEKHSSPPPRQPTPKRIDSPAKEQPVKEEKPPQEKSAKQKSPSPERKVAEKQQSPPPRQKSAKQKSPSPTPPREKSFKHKSPSPERKAEEKQLSPPPRQKSVNERPPSSPIPREKTPEKPPTPTPRRQQNVDNQLPPSPPPRQRPVEREPTPPIPPPRRPKNNSAPSLKKANSPEEEPPKPSSAIIETTVPISLIADNPQIFEKNVQPLEQVPISNNHPMKLFPDPKQYQTKKSKNTYKSIQRSMDRYRFHLW